MMALQERKLVKLIAMAGTKTSGRPGGNPDIKKYGFKTDRPEPLKEKLQIRITASMKQKLSETENWQEFVREAIQEKLERVPPQGS